MAFHQDALGTLGDGAPAERAFEIVVLGEAAQHDIDRALPILGVGVGDVGEDAPLGGLLDELRSRRVKQDDHRAGRLLDDLLDQAECVLGALAQPDERHVRSLPGCHGTDVFDVDLACDHLVPERGDDRRDEGQAILALVRDQHTQMLGLEVHSRS